MATRRSSDASPDRASRMSAPSPAARADKPSAAEPPPRVTLSAESRHAMIAENAYLRAERRGFEPGHETEDWLAAETEVDALLRVGFGGSSQ